MRCSGGSVTASAPLRWSEINPVVRTAFASPWLAGRMVIKGTRKLMRAGLGMIRRYPSLISIYMNAAHVDLDAFSAAVVADRVETLLATRPEAIVEALPDGSSYLITVAWQGMSLISAPAPACGKNLYNGAAGSACTGDLCRRVLTTIVRIGTLK